MIRVRTHRPPVRPGRMLALEVLEPDGLTRVELARRLQVPARRISSPSARHSVHSQPTIRSLASPADYAACVALQHETWGPDFGEAVPPAILKVAQRLGGVAAGAFDDDGRLLGFVFGMTGVENGRVVHWSDMLAVRPELRDAGLGRRLKEWQREAARAAGATVMYWTFDPLVARNAHLNFNRLGTRAHEYARDMYGDATSSLHRGLGTDRLIVAWPIDSPPHASACPGGTAAELPAALAGARRITIPLDIHALVASDPAAAAEWRRSTRAAWEGALREGLEVACFYREPAAVVGHYVLTPAGDRAAPESAGVGVGPGGRAMAPGSVR